MKQSTICHYRMVVRTHNVRITPTASGMLVGKVKGACSRRTRCT